MTTPRAPNTPPRTLTGCTCLAAALFALPAPGIADQPPASAGEAAVQGDPLAAADELYRQADKAYSDGRTAEAANWAEEALRIYRRIRASDDNRTLVTLALLANSYSTLDRQTEALKLSEETFTLVRQRFGPVHPVTAASMGKLADRYSDLGRHAEALNLWKEAHALLRQELGPEDPATLESMGNLALSYKALGRYPEALKLQEDTLALRRKTLGHNDAATLQSMNNLATTYNALGRYAEALKLQEETLTLRRNTLGPEHPDTLDSMNNLASSYRGLARHAEALKLFEEALVLTRNKRGPEHRSTLSIMSNVAVSYGDLGRHAEALKLKEETFTLRRKTLGPEHPDTLDSMNNLAASYSYLGRHAEALRLNEETLALRRMKHDSDHPDTLMTMNNLAVAYSALGRHTEALKLQEETLALRRKKLGHNHADILQSMNNLAVSYHQAARRSDALPLRRESLDVLDRIAERLTALTRDERSTTLAQYQSYYTRFARELAEDPADFPEALSVTERGKARSLLEELTARQAIAHSGIPADAGERLLDLRNRLATLDGKLAVAPNDAARQPLRSARDAARDELSALRSDLIARYPRFAALSAVKTIGLDEGRALLPAKGVFVSWLFDGKQSGVALALPKEGALAVLKSDPGQDLNGRAETYRWLHALPDSRTFREALSQVPLAAWLAGDKGELLMIGSPERKPADARDVPASLYERLREPALAAHGQWLSDRLLTPLAASIGNAEQWILSPDGILATLPWDTLPWQGKPLGEQKQLTVIQSLSLYQLLKSREADYARERAATPGQPLLAMGDARYSGPPDKTGDARSPRFQRAPVSGGGSDRQSTDPYAEMQGQLWMNLPATKNEVDALHALLGGRKVLGPKASEATLRNLSKSGELAQFRHLHFAAHGYLNTRYPHLSALVLTKTGTDEANDGFITAGEWPGFDLKSDLMVMSACETGLGKTVSGEGVQGLPYALYVAGNRDTLLSLWKVDDAGTAVFMQRFWAKVKAGAGYATALAQTKREMQRGDAGLGYADPYYWAPFVLYGVQEG